MPLVENAVAFMLGALTLGSLLLLMAPFLRRRRAQGMHHPYRREKTLPLAHLEAELLKARRALIEAEKAQGRAEAALAALKDGQEKRTMPSAVFADKAAHTPEREEQTASLFLREGNARQEEGASPLPEDGLSMEERLQRIEGLARQLQALGRQA